MLVVLHGLTVALGNEKGGPSCWIKMLPSKRVEGEQTNAWNRRFCGGIGATFKGSPAGAAPLRPSSMAELLRPLPATELVQPLPQREPFGTAL